MKLILKWQQAVLVPKIKIYPPKGIRGKQCLSGSELRYAKVKEDVETGGRMSGISISLFHIIEAEIYLDIKMKER